MKTEDTRPEDQTPATSRIATRRLAVWKILVFVWLGTVAFFVSCELIGSNLSRSWADYLGGCALLGLLFGTVAYFVFFGPAALLLTFLLRLTKTSTKAFTACLTLAALAALWILGVTYSESRTASGQVHRFKLITRQELPGQGKLLGWGHGFGLADKRHIWVFEGTPEEFDQFNKALAWKQKPGTGIEDDDGLALVAKALGPGIAWSPEEAYGSPDTGDDQPGTLIVDKDHKHWLVWWAAI